MRITKLEYQKKDPNRVNIYVDGKFTVGIGTNDVIKLGLYKDQEISSDFLNKVIAESGFGKEFNSALNFLSFRPRSEFEMRQFFRRKKYEFGEQILEKLKALGQINDEEFAKWYIDQRNTFRPKGKKALKSELLKKGVKVDMPTDFNEKEMALKALKKYHGTVDQLKIKRYLANRGFSWDVIEEVVKKDYNEI